MNHSSDITRSVQALKRDRRFAPLIKKHGNPTLKRGTDVFTALTRSITYQQLSGKAAGTIYKRFLALFPRKKPTPERVLALSPETLRACGLSRSKVTYLKDLAEKFADKSINHKRFPTMSSDEIVEHLVRVKGIGEWSAHMLLIFTLNRADILPTGDLAIRKGFQILYKLKELPSKADMEKLAAPWRQHATVASWYLWRAADEAKN